MDENERTRSIKPASLSNYGANCYMNSALQGISSCDKFVKDIEKIYKENKDLAKLSIFHQLILILNGGKMDRMEISRNQIFREWNKPGQQDSFELLTYVINQVYNEIRKSKEKIGIIPKRDTKAWLKISLPMRVIIEYKIRCDCGSIVDVPRQSYLALHVTIPLKQDFDLQTLVNQFFKEDRIENYECGTDCCDGKGAIRFTRLCDPLSRTICIHLQRTFWNGHKMMKIDKRIEFSKILEIKSKYRTFENIEALHVTEKINEFTKVNIDKTDSSAVSDSNYLNTVEEIPLNVESMVRMIDKVIGESLPTPNQNKENEIVAYFVQDSLPEKPESESNETATGIVHDSHLEILESESNEIASGIVHDSLRDKPESSIDDVVIEKDETYHLTSVIVHYGSVYGGHYVCYKYLDGRWFLTNDSQIEKVSEQNVLNCNPYILFYEKS